MLAKGPMRQVRLAEALEIDRRTLFMCIATALEHGLVTAGREYIDGSRSVEVHYTLAVPQPVDHTRPARRITERLSGLRPSAAALRYANPFGASIALARDEA